jgi:hypothetical protein
LKKYKEKKYIAEISKLFYAGRIVIDSPRSKGLALLVRHPIKGDMWMG